MKRIILSLALVVLAGTIAVGATRAFLADSDTASNNTFAAATLDLKTNNQDGVTSVYTLTNMKPGAWDLAGQVILKNAGTIKGHAWYEIKNVRNYENGCNIPETRIPDTSCGTGTDQGELGGLAKASLQANKDTSPTNYDRYPVSPIVINSALGIHYDIKDLNPDETLPIVVYGVWANSPTSSDNIAQGDSVVFDVVFHLDQI